MIHKTRGVVFRFTRYSESSIIVTIFTELFGLQAYIVNGVRSKSAKSKMALYQPLTLLDLVVYHRENAAIMRIKEVKCLYPYRRLAVDIRKSSIALFLHEVLNKAVREESHAQELCSFIIDSLIQLDQLPEPVENYHLIFLLQLSRYLGFEPQHLREVTGSEILSEEEDVLLNKLITTKSVAGNISYQARTRLLEVLVRFYSSHIENFGELRSIAVLREVLS